MRWRSGIQYYHPKLYLRRYQWPQKERPLLGGVCSPLGITVPMLRSPRRSSMGRTCPCLGDITYLVGELHHHAKMPWLLLECYIGSAEVN
ncbi:hypothetical protein BDV26DRAFT_254742 [Aspergillus bertholletiae]|uniref:Uncharacterized protein n=1 Tax=Aspergillus bertholletiae TaxID=1226010 RepID=A0A5N7BJ88_9EURO|nr:hypothetical protein BDV26DRAFT_254742 [Aspergillus bertholletiae]